MKETEPEAINSRDKDLTGPLAWMIWHLNAAQKRLRAMNGEQRRVFLGMTFFLLINAIILLLGIVLAGMIIGRLSG